LQIKYLIRFITLVLSLFLILFTIINGFGDGLTVILSLLFFLMNIFPTFIRNNRYKGLYYFFSIINLVFIGFGILLYTVVPELVLNIRTILYIDLSYMFFLFGMVLGGKITIPVRSFPLIRKNSLNKRMTLPYNIIIIIIIGIISNTGSFLFPNFISSLGIGLKLKLFINIIFNYQFYYLILFLLIYNDYRFYKSFEKLILLLLIVTFVLFKLLIGVKSGIIQISIFLLIAFLTMSPDFKIPKKAMSFFLILFPLILLSYHIGLSVRELMRNQYHTGNVGLIEVYISIYNNISIYDLDAISIFKKFTERVSEIDQLDILFNNKKNLTKWATNYFEYLTNLLLPGSFFSNVVSPALYFKVAYLNVSLSEALTSYHSVMLPLYGEVYSLSGPLSLIILFFIGFIYINTINFLISQDYFSRIAVYAFSMYILYGLLFGMGFVLAIQQLMYSIIIPGIIFVIFFRKTLFLLKNTHPLHYRI
jgi:hypothetical protein